MENRTGIINYFNEMFLGREELLKKQDMERAAFVKLLQVFGQKGLFNLENRGLTLRCEFDSQNEVSYITLEQLDSNGKILGISADGSIITMVEKTFPKLGAILERYPDSIYIGIKYLASSSEEGTVTVSNDGTVTGIGTNFEKFLRGSTRKSRLKINGNIFVVSQVVNDTLLYLEGTNFPSIIDSKYSIVPTMSPFSANVTESLYRYDSAFLVISDMPFNEMDTFQIFEGTSADLKINGSLKFSQVSLLKKTEFNSVGTEELKSNSVSTSKLSLENKPVNNLTDTNNILGGPYVMELFDLLKFNNESDSWILKKVDIQATSFPLKALTISLGDFSEDYETYPYKLDLVIDRVGDRGGHIQTTILLGSTTIVFPVDASRLIISFQKIKSNNSASYQYLYHIIC